MVCGSVNFDAVSVAYLCHIGLNSTAAYVVLCWFKSYLLFLSVRVKCDNNFFTYLHPWYFFSSCLRNCDASVLSFDFFPRTTTLIADTSIYYLNISFRPVTSYRVLYGLGLQATVSDCSRSWNWLFFVSHAPITGARRNLARLFCDLDLDSVLIKVGIFNYTPTPLFRLIRACFVAVIVITCKPCTT